MPDTYEMLEARSLLAEGKYAEAIAELDKTPEEERNAEWHALRAEAEEKLEHYYDAVNSLKKAAELDPENAVYKERLKEYKRLQKKGSGKTSRGCLPSCCGSKCCTSDDGCECCGEICCGGICECLCESCDCS